MYEPVVAKKAGRPFSVGLSSDNLWLIGTTCSAAGNSPTKGTASPPQKKRGPILLGVPSENGIHVKVQANVEGTAFSVRRGIP